jgi:hypothetical protein
MTGWRNPHYVTETLVENWASLYFIANEKAISYTIHFFDIYFRSPALSKIANLFCCKNAILCNTIQQRTQIVLFIV